MAVAFSPKASPVTSAQARARATYRNLFLWTLQGWVAMFFIAAGYAKLTESNENLVTLLSWPARFTPAFVMGLGVAEIVLALGLLAPLVSWKIGRPLLVVAAVGLIAAQVLMLCVHALGGQFGLAVVNLILLGFTIPIYLGRRA